MVAPGAPGGVTPEVSAQATPASCRFWKRLHTLGPTGVNWESHSLHLPRSA